MNLQLIAEGLRLIADGLSKSEPVTETKKPVKSKEKKKKAETVEKVKEEPVEEDLLGGESAESEKVYTKQEVLAIMSPAITAHGRDKVLAILTKYKAKNISQVKEDDYNAIVKDLQDLA